MHRYWFKFDIAFPEPYGVLLGCGVTASNLDLAKEYINHIVFKRKGLPDILTVVEDVDVASLDRKHILPNIADVNKIGVWYPAYRQGQDVSVLQEVLNAFSRHQDVPESDKGSVG